MVGKGFQVIKFERKAVKFAPCLFYFISKLLDFAFDLSDGTEIVAVDNHELSRQLVNVHIILRRVGREGITLTLNISSGESVCEAIYNALGHNNYADSVPIQIRIDDEAMYISNNCVLPRAWTVDTLLQPHKSITFNPSIANVFYSAGYIEAWGRGIQKIFESCNELGSPVPEYKQLGDDLTVKFIAAKVKPQRSKNPKHQNEALDDALNEALDNRIIAEIKK